LTQNCWKPGSVSDDEAPTLIGTNLELLCDPSLGGLLVGCGHGPEILGCWHGPYDIAAAAGADRESLKGTRKIT
jgi:hypothetical protein